MAKSKKQFKSEVQELLNLVIHSLYSNTDIFLRELIANASDAIDRLRFESLTRKELIDEKADRKIKIHPDEENNTLTILDNGIGMTRAEVEMNIGTIARSGTRAFLTELKEANPKDMPELIGQFGVGFYSSFMVADRVTLTTRKAGESGGSRWVSTGDGSYTIDDCEKPDSGTEIVLHLREDKAEYLQEWRIRNIVKQFSDFIEYPVAMDISREEAAKDDEGNEIKDAEKITVIEEQTLNSMKAIWTRRKDEVKDEDYHEFYKHISHDYTDPLKTIHYSAEGAIEFNSLLYIPARAPFDLFTRDEQKGIHLYVKRVFIMDDCKELIPEYLRFVRGVVESNDLPLNISREILQEDALIQKIKKSLVNKLLSTLKEMKEKKPEDYLNFYKEFGKVLKEGLHFDFSNKEKLYDLVMFESSKTDKSQFATLDEYVKRMVPGQKEIYYLTGESRNVVENSPHLEIFKEKDIEVLFLTDPIDEWITQGMTDYKENKFRAINRGDITLDFVDGDQSGEGDKDEAKKDEDKKYEGLLTLIKDRLSKDIKEVKLSSRLTQSASCLVSDEFGMSPHMERMMKSMNQDGAPSQRILELNAKHPILGVMLNLFEKNQKSKKLGDYSELLYNQALLSAGCPIDNPLRLTQLISDLMVFEGKNIAKVATKKNVAKAKKK